MKYHLMLGVFSVSPLRHVVSNIVLFSERIWRCISIASITLTSSAIFSQLTLLLRRPQIHVHLFPSKNHTRSFFSDFQDVVLHLQLILLVFFYIFVSFNYCSIFPICLHSKQRTSLQSFVIVVIPGSKHCLFPLTNLLNPYINLNINTLYP